MSWFKSKFKSFWWWVAGLGGILDSGVIEERIQDGTIVCASCENVLAPWYSGDRLRLGIQWWCSGCNSGVYPVWRSYDMGDDLGTPMHPAMTREVVRALGEKLDNILLTADNYEDPSKCKRLVEAVDVVVVELKRHGVKMAISKETMNDLEFMGENVSRETKSEGGE